MHLISSGINYSNKFICFTQYYFQSQPSLLEEHLLNLFTSLVARKLHLIGHERE